MASFKYCVVTSSLSTTGIIKTISCLLVFILFMGSHRAGAQTKLNTPPRTIRVVMDNNYAPYSFQSDDGKLQGILIDQWRGWEKMNSIKVGVPPMGWHEPLRLKGAGGVGGIDCIVETADRQQ